MAEGFLHSVTATRNPQLQSLRIMPVARSPAPRTRIHGRLKPPDAVPWKTFLAFAVSRLSRSSAVSAAALSSGLLWKIFGKIPGEIFLCQISKLSSCLLLEGPVIFQKSFSLFRQLCSAAASSSDTAV